MTMRQGATVLMVVMAIISMLYAYAFPALVPSP